MYDEIIDTNDYIISLDNKSIDVYEMKENIQNLSKSFSICKQFQLV